MRDEWVDTDAKRNQILLDDKVLQHIGALANQMIERLVDTGFEVTRAKHTTMKMFMASVSSLPAWFLMRTVEFDHRLTDEQKQAAYRECERLRDLIFDTILGIIRDHDLGDGRIFYRDEHEDN